MTDTTRDREKRLPEAEFDNPTCGVCFSETNDNGDTYICHSCGITYSHITLEASIADPDKPACNKPCTSEWHTHRYVNPGYRWKCYPCALTADHATNECHGGCHIILNTPNTNALAAETGDPR
ncbi:hypothetical protein ICM05_09770 [Leucobacter sp. cx-42]|uniref:hypothetical protein n=1 Tax=unclassified Leucobacter TaxID=2621730 RepID=UPI00165DF1AD|nr:MULTISPECIES: hypothetical protein [unclassified Leucobacter]MBC9954925.1 hypothetical protein [Leucobacter sp. cx-42]